MSILGTRVVRTEDPGFLTTGAVYTDDVVDERLAGACHVFFVRSPIAHARITSVDTSAALEAPGVIAVFTGADPADLAPLGPPMPDMVNGRIAHRCWPGTWCATSASRWPSSSPRTPTRGRTRPSWSAPTTTRCPPWWI